MKSKNTESLPILVEYDIDRVISTPQSFREFFKQKAKFEREERLNSGKQYVPVKTFEMNLSQQVHRNGPQRSASNSRLEIGKKVRIGNCLMRSDRGDTSADSTWFEKKQGRIIKYDIVQ